MYSTYYKITNPRSSAIQNYTFINYISIYQFENEILLWCTRCTKLRFMYTEWADWFFCAFYDKCLRKHHCSSCIFKFTNECYIQMSPEDLLIIQTRGIHVRELVNPRETPQVWECSFVKTINAQCKKKYVYPLKFNTFNIRVSSV